MSAHADEMGDDPPSLVLRGFGTLGAVRSDTDDAQFVRDLTQRDGGGSKWTGRTDSVLGLQANWRLADNAEVVMQGVSRYRPQGNFSPELTWAFVHYDPAPEWSLRLGRLGTDFYMLADSRWVGYSYLTVRPVQDYYGTLPFNYIDGGDLVATKPFAGGLLRGKVFAGVAREQSPWGNQQFDLDGSLMTGAYLDYQTGPWQFRLGHAQVRFGHELPVEDFYQTLEALSPGSSQQLRVKDKLTRFESAGLAYDDGPLQAQLMVSRTSSDHAAFQGTWAGYAQLGYRLETVTPFVGYSRAFSHSKQLKQPVSPLTDLFLDEFRCDQYTWFVGARWDFRSNMALKVQYDRIFGTADSRFLFRNETAAWSGDMGVLSVALDFVF